GIRTTRLSPTSSGSVGEPLTTRTTSAAPTATSIATTPEPKTIRSRGFRRICIGVTSPTPYYRAGGLRNPYGAYIVLTTCDREACGLGRSVETLLAKPDAVSEVYARLGARASCPRESPGTHAGR